MMVQREATAQDAATLLEAINRRVSSARSARIELRYASGDTEFDKLCMDSGYVIRVRVEFVKPDFIRIAGDYVHDNQHKATIAAESFADGKLRFKNIEHQEWQTIVPEAGTMIPVAIRKATHIVLETLFTGAPDTAFGLSDFSTIDYEGQTGILSVRNTFLVNRMLLLVPHESMPFQTILHKLERRGMKTWFGKYVFDTWELIE